MAEGARVCALSPLRNSKAMKALTPGEEVMIGALACQVRDGDWEARCLLYGPV